MGLYNPLNINIIVCEYMFSCWNHSEAEQTITHLLHNNRSINEYCSSPIDILRLLAILSEQKKRKKSTDHTPLKVSSTEIDFTEASPG